MPAASRAFLAFSRYSHCMASSYSSSWIQKCSMRSTLLAEQARTSTMGAGLATMRGSFLHMVISTCRAWSMDSL